MTSAVKRIFADHPASVGESYFEHLRRAGSIGLRLVASGLACFIHALVPSAFTHTGSETIERLHREVIALRDRQAGRS